MIKIKKNLKNCRIATYFYIYLLFSFSTCCADIVAHGDKKELGTYSSLVEIEGDKFLYLSWSIEQGTYLISTNYWSKNPGVYSAYCPDYYEVSYSFDGKLWSAPIVMNSRAPGGGRAHVVISAVYKSELVILGNIIIPWRRLHEGLIGEDAIMQGPLVFYIKVKLEIEKINSQLGILDKIEAISEPMEIHKEAGDLIYIGSSIHDNRAEAVMPQRLESNLSSDQTPSIVDNPKK
jgi:hypothetical protein